MSESLTEVRKLTFTCHRHPLYKAVRKPRPGCVLCHAMWQNKQVEIERKKKEETK